MHLEELPQFLCPDCRTSCLQARQMLSVDNVFQQNTGFSAILIFERGQSSVRRQDDRGYCLC